MTHPSELFTANAISILRHLDLAQPLKSGEHFVPDIYLSWDTEDCDVDITMKSVSGQMMRLWGKVEGTPRWLSLNISLGETTFKPGDVFGVVVEYEGCAGYDFMPFIRSSREGVITDATLQDHFSGSEDRSIATLLHTVKPDSDLIGPSAYRTLIIPLPRVDFTFNLRDLRSFVVPAARGWTQTAQAQAAR